MYKLIWENGNLGLYWNSKSSHNDFLLNFMYSFISNVSNIWWTQCVLCNHRFYVLHPCFQVDLLRIYDMALSVISVHIQRRIRYKMKKKLRTMLGKFTWILTSILQWLSQARVQKFTVNEVNCKISHKTFHYIKILLKLKKVYIQNLLQIYRLLYMNIIVQSN